MTKSIKIWQKIGSLFCGGHLLLGMGCGMSVIDNPLNKTDFHIYVC